MSRGNRGGFERSRQDLSKIQSSGEEYAVALEYKDEWGDDAAPKIIAKGRGELAQRIKDTAQQNEIMVQRNSDLVGLLYASEIGDEIPIDAFIVVAEIIRFIYEKNGKL